MKTYKFVCRSTRDGFTEWASVLEDGVEVKKIDRDVWQETVRQFRERVGAELEAQAAKSAQTADELRTQIVELKAQGESDRIDFRLRLAGARNLKAARAVLADHASDVETLVSAELWMFSQAGGASQKTSQNIGATGM